MVALLNGGAVIVALVAIDVIVDSAVVLRPPEVNAGSIVVLKTPVTVVAKSPEVIVGTAVVTLMNPVVV